MLKKFSSKNLYKDIINNKRTKNKRNKRNKKTKNKRKAGSRSREKSSAAKKIQANIRGKLTRKKLKHLIERFSSKSKSKFKYLEICTICLENVSKSDQSTICCKSNHTYHAKCINELLSNNHFNCPSCRQSLEFKIKLNDDIKTKAKIIADKVLKKYSIQQLEYFGIIISGFSDEFRGNFDSKFINQCDYALRFIRNMIDLHNRSEEIEKLLEKKGLKKTTDYINKSYDIIIDTIKIINEFVEAEEQEQEQEE